MKTMTIDDYIHADPKHRFFAITLGKIQHYANRLPAEAYAPAYREQSEQLDVCMRQLTNPGVSEAAFKRSCQQLMVGWLAYSNPAKAAQEAERLAL